MIRKILFLSVLGVAVFFLLNVFATPTTEPTWIVRLHASHGLQVGDPVEDGKRGIGQVIAVESHEEKDRTPMTDVTIALDPLFRDRMREQSIVLVTTPFGTGRPVLRLIVLDQQSPPLAPGSIVASAESEMEVELKRQLLAAAGMARDLGRQLEGWGKTIDKTLQSEELKKLEENAGGLIETLRRTQDQLSRAIAREIDRLRKLYEKFFAKEQETAAWRPEQLPHRL